MRKMTHEGEQPHGLPYTVKLVAEMIEVWLSDALMGSLCLLAIFRIWGKRQHNKGLLVMHSTWQYGALAELDLH